MPSTSQTAGVERLLHCSPARAVIERQDAALGGPVVSKVYTAGSLAEAEHEFAMGRLAQGDGVVEHLAVGLDPVGSRPMVTTRHEQGIDLAHLVAERGALPAVLACELLAPVASTLARLHALRAPAAQRGLCHGDVKPANLLRAGRNTLLLDFEHARAVGSPASGTAGTPAFAAPEERPGAPASPALDVFALGRTLEWLLAGGAAVRPPQHADVEALLQACTQRDPHQRPDAANVAGRLRELAARLAADAGEARLDDWATATFSLPPAAGDADARSRPWRSRRRLRDRRPELLARPSALPSEPRALDLALQAAERLLRRFPRHAATLRWRRELVRAAGRMLSSAAAHTAAEIRAEAFASARQWLAEAGPLAARALAQPGGCPIPLDEPPAAAGLLHRDPIQFLHLLTDGVDAARTELHEHAARIAAAEQALDLRAAEAEVEQLAARHGGASPTAARHRDRLHRLAFYLDRVARAEANVERVGPLWDAIALRPLATLVAAAARDRHGDDGGAAVGLRSLQLTLMNLAEEFPHLPQVPPALEALTLALAHVTDQAWQLLADARQRLQAIPVPVRPLQLVLGRLDTFRILEAFVDLPERPRSQLLDGIESLRLAFEQARATRDRLAESAEHALARGHWTTGLFDMERAVAGLHPADEHERAEAARLQQRLTEVRRKREELEAAVRRNVDLATRYGALQDDPGSTFALRLSVLAERRDCLLFLAMHVPAERAVLYHRDLQETETQLALERAAQAEHELDGTVDPAARLQVARTTLEQLAGSTDDPNATPPGRLLRVLEHWRTLATQCQRAVDQQQAEQALRRRHRRRVVAVLVAAVLVTASAVLFAARPWLAGEPAHAGTSK